jgi:hypothetical protein
MVLKFSNYNLVSDTIDLKQVLSCFFYIEIYIFLMRLQGTSVTFVLSSWLWFNAHDIYVKDKKSFSSFKSN